MRNWESVIISACASGSTISEELASSLPFNSSLFIPNSLLTGRSLSGRSKQRTWAPARWHQRTACHSGENSANGKNDAWPGCLGLYKSSATGGTNSGSARVASAASPSAGHSSSTISGRKASSAATRLAALPGPWWRMPKRRKSVGIPREKAGALAAPTAAGQQGRRKPENRPLAS